MQDKKNIIIILLTIVILILIYIVFKPKAVIAPLPQNETKEVVKDTTVQTKEYKNEELGFSFSYPEKYGEIKSAQDLPVIMSGVKGYYFRGYLALQNPFFYFTGMTKDYVANGDRDFDCGESRSTYTELSRSYKESVNKNGERFLYSSSTVVGDLHPPHHVAFFEAKGNYSLLGFCSSIDVPKEEFLQVMDSVDLK